MRAYLSIFGILLVGICSFGIPAHAATKKVVPIKLEVSGWLPYWRAATSSADVLPHLNQLTEINPFGYTVKNDGTLYDAGNLNSATSSYATLIAAARAQKVRVIPTVMWSNTDAISAMLSTSQTRAVNIASIVQTINQNNFDGIDIDYEGKKASDIHNFAAFLKELYKAMGKKYVMCTIEARTPPQDLNTNTPVDQFQYANDLPSINKYCDRVRIMTYDQESADKTLNNAAGNGIYSPVSDPKWVTAVVKLMSKDIKPSKIEIGVATYGYGYDITPYANNSGYMYDLLWSFNPKYATDIASSLGITPTRNASGELEFTYVPTSTPPVTPASTNSATPTNPNLQASAGTAVAQAQGLTGTERYMTWSDSVSIAQKIALAKKLGVRGIAIFKLDGGEDQNLWNVLPTQR